MSDVLVDSSVWVDFFRGVRPTVDRVDALLADDRAAVTAAIIAEVASGARSAVLFQQIRNRLRALSVLSEPPDLWDRVADLRFGLARQGVQCHLVDLAIAITASEHGHVLLTRDRDFQDIVRLLPLDLDVY